ncbi:MAG: bile acid:sodium symporter family protein [Treponema sp.]|jgi:predicted Na+-dependent transporter|nr:bile acid:sodium symporter family protein [Treponema sp.]
MTSSRKHLEIAQNINRQLERLIPITTPAGIILGFLLPAVFINLRPLVPLLFGIMTFSGALKLKAAEMGASVKNPIPIALFFISAHIIMPVVSKLLVSLFIDDENILTGFILVFASPTAVSSFFWVMIFKGDKALGLTLILLDTMLAPIVVPGTLFILLGKTVAMDMTGIAISLFLMVVLPTILGVGTNEISRGKVPSIISPYLDPVSKICLILVIAANASPLASKIQFNDPLVWLTAIICIALIVIGFIIIYLFDILFKFKKDKGISLILMGGLRNNSAAMTIAVTFFANAAVSLPVIMSLIFQQTIAAFVGKLISKRYHS